MTAWRGVCRQCGELTVEGRAWCRVCLDRIKTSGVSDTKDDFRRWEFRKMDTPDKHRKLSR
jgi:hypothetical protein